MISLWLIAGGAGILGGIANHLSARRTIQFQKKPSARLMTYLGSSEAIFYSTVQGLVASSLSLGVLAMVAKESVQAIAGDDMRQFSLFALCVAAATLGDKFTSPLLRKLTSEVESLEFRAKVLEKAHTEPDEHSISRLHARQTDVEDDPVLQVFEALSQGKWVYRTEEGLLQSTGLLEDELAAALKQLKADGSIDSMKTEGGVIRWYRVPNNGTSS